ncbi:MAG: thiamine phosphate synthase [Actinobacteria bacterium]|nr:thiamine phosphate synthase [Actinomycetota bacterium]
MGVQHDGPRRRTRLDAARLYLCTPARPALAEFVGAACEAGVDVVQLRDKVLADDALVEAAAVTRDAAHAHDALFILNDRPDLVDACGADGVHVGQEDASPAECRALLGDDLLVGLSTHSSRELTASLTEPVDYISVGPVEPTPTKPGRPGTGLGYVTEAALVCSHRPFFVTGGVSPATLADIAAAGATRFVVVRAVTEAPDPASAVRQLRKLIDSLFLA